MNIWFNAIARAGGIEVAPSTGSNPAGPSTAHGNRPTLARRVLAASALHHWLLGNIGTFDFVRYATLVNSENFSWVTCLIGA